MRGGVCRWFRHVKEPPVTLLVDALAPLEITNMINYRFAVQAARTGAVVLTKSPSCSHTSLATGCAEECSGSRAAFACRSGLGGGGGEASCGSPDTGT